MGSRGALTRLIGWARPGATERTPYDRFGRIRFADGALRDLRGETIVLRGVSLFWSQWEPEYFTPETIAWLARDWRIDVVRVPVAAMDPGYLSTPREELRKAHLVIDAAIRAGLYVVVDWHGHQPHTRRAIEFFEAISAAYGNDPHLLYEPCNEPAAGFEWPEIARHHAAVADTIRANAPDAPLILGVPHFCTAMDVATAMPADIDNAAYAFHFYAASHREGLRAKLELALENGLSIFVTEWGLGEATGDGILDPDEAGRWLAFLNAHRVSHINWSICDKREACAALMPGAPPAGRWRRGHLSASGRFVRSYLRRIGAQAASGR